LQETRPYSAGENIGLGYESIDKAIDHWYQESESYNYRTGHSNNGKETEHFTQVIWKATTDVGCGFAYCQNLRSSIYVCNYGPTGNVNSEYRDNVPLPI
jgi:hypothetical protein